MNHPNASTNTSRRQLTEWWTDLRPLLRRDGPRLALWAAVVAVLWTAGAWCSARYESLKPRVDLAPIDMTAYVKRGQDLPKDQNAAWAYLVADRLLQKEKLLNSQPNAGDRTQRLTQEELRQRAAAHRQWLAAVTAKTDGVIAQMRADARRPQCVFPLMRLGIARQLALGHVVEYAWSAPQTLAGCLGKRALSAGYQGDAAGWAQAMDDLLGLAEALKGEYAPEMVKVQYAVLERALRALELGCSTGAATEDACLAALDRRLEALHPLDAVEPLMALAHATIRYDASAYFNVYPHYRLYVDSEGRQIGPKALDEVYCISGFAARDRFACAAYFNGALEALRSKPDHESYAWFAQREEALHHDGLTLTANYDRLSRETVAYGVWYGTPSTCFASLTKIRMARALIAVMRQGRDAQGLFRAGEPAYLNELLKPFTNPFNGKALSTKIDAYNCELVWSFRVSLSSGDEWRVKVTLPVPGAPGA